MQLMGIRAICCCRKNSVYELAQQIEILVIFGGFPKWGTPKWMVYQGNPIKMDDLGVPPFIESLIYLLSNQWMPGLSRPKSLWESRTGLCSTPPLRHMRFRLEIAPRLAAACDPHHYWVHIEPET